MYGVVKIGDVDVEMVSNGATPYRFKQIFREDYFRIATKKNRDASENVDTMIKVGFVMAMQAKKADMAKLNEESFYQWLEQFGTFDVISVVPDITDIMNGNEETKADPKKEAAH